MITLKDFARLRRAWPYVVSFAIVAALIIYAAVSNKSDDGDRLGAPSRSSPTSATKLEGPPPGTSIPRSSKTTSLAPSGGTTLIDWIEDYGPMGGATGVKNELFATVTQGLCEETLTEVTGGTASVALDETVLAIYRGAALACLAAFNHRPDLWTEAQSAVADVTGREPLVDCLDSAVLRLWRSLIDAHRTHPTAQLVRGSRGSASRPHCPRILSLNPDHGAASGGYRIKITGEYLPNPAVIHVDEYITTVATNSNRAVITVPPADPDYDIVPVWVEGWPYWPAGTPAFTYDQAATTKAPSSAPPSGSTTTPEPVPSSGNGR